MLENRTAIITGAGSGIGLETAKRFSQGSGYNRIYAVDKNPLVYGIYADEDVVKPIKLDLRDRDTVGLFIQQVLERDGRVDVLVNGAGVLNVGRVETYYDENGKPTPEYEELLATDYIAPLRLMKLVLPTMRNQGSGIVVNITSTKEYVQDPYHMPYADLKAKLSKASRRISRFESVNGVRITTLQPGNTKTSIDPGLWTPGSDRKEATEVQSLNDWWRKVFGNNPKNVAEVIYKIAEGEITDERVLVGIDAKLASIMHDHMPYWDNLFSLGYKSALILTRLSMAIQTKKPTRIPQEVLEKLKENQVKIVQLKPDDWKILRDLKISSQIQEPIAFEDFEEGMQRYESRTEAEWRRELDEDLSGKVTVFAVDAESYVGMVTAKLDRDGEGAQIQHMYVDASRRGKGIGRSLLTRLIAEIQARNIYNARLTVLETQIPAKNLYESIGFRPTVTVNAWRGEEEFKETLMRIQL